MPQSVQALSHAISLAAAEVGPEYGEGFVKDGRCGEWIDPMVLCTHEGPGRHLSEDARGSTREELLRYGLCAKTINPSAACPA